MRVVTCRLWESRLGHNGARGNYTLGRRAKNRQTMIVQHHVEHRASAKVLKHLGFQEIRGADGHAEKDVCQYQRIALLK